MKILSVFSLLLLFSGCASVPPAVPLSEVEILKINAEAGDSMSQFDLGLVHDIGYGGVDKDLEKAKKWYRLAAEAGHANAQNSIATFYEKEGKLEQAIFWYEKSIAQNNVLAMNNLAILYESSTEFEEGLEKAYELYLRAANLGNPSSMYNLGHVIASGALGDDRTIEACIWLRRAVTYSGGPGSSQYEPALKAAGTCEGSLSEEELIHVRTTANSWIPSK